MYREIITPKSDKYSIKIPKEYINKNVEILVLPFFYKGDVDPAKKQSVDFSKYCVKSFKKINSLKYQQDLRNEW